jgi:general secretion pathway protein A
VYRSFFGLKEKPFSIAPDQRFIYLTDKHREALAHMLYGVVENGGFVLLTGEVGTGKTLASRRLVSRLPDNVEIALCINPRLSDLELLATICDELGIAHPWPRTTLKELVDLINRYLLLAYGRGHRVLLIIDEAQNLEPSVLEQIRLLTNLETDTNKLLQIILIGQPELLQVLDRHELRQLNQRITARYRLMPLSRKETRGYIRHRLAIGGYRKKLFERGAVNEIYRASGGVPRLINSMCERCLLGAFVMEKRRVNRRIALGAIAEVIGDGRTRRRLGRRMVPWMAVTAALALAILSLHPSGIDRAFGIPLVETATRVFEPIRRTVSSLFATEASSGGTDLPVSTPLPAP